MVVAVVSEDAEAEMPDPFYKAMCARCQDKGYIPHPGMTTSLDVCNCVIGDLLWRAVSVLGKPDE